MRSDVINASISPDGLLDILSKSEVNRLLDTNQGGLYRIFRNCALAVLNSGAHAPDGRQLLEQYRDFDIRILQEERGIKLELINAPASAFVDGKMIQGIREHLVTVVRDLLYAREKLADYDLGQSEQITDAVFHLLRNANAMVSMKEPNLIVCWGGHAISRLEYDYTKQVGYQLGLRGLDICTGCGVGAMKGPMKGATIGHAKQRITHNRYIGLSEPGIIAAESPNAIVNNLVIMPDIEKRLEAFVRLGHGFIVFPGGAGTVEELLYLLGLLSNEANSDIPFPLVLTGPESSRGYLAELDEFVASTLGDKARTHYDIIVDNPAAVAQAMQEGVRKVTEYRKQTDDAYYFNWRLNIPIDFQQPFIPDHSSMRSLNLKRNQNTDQLTANLRRAFSGIVAGNVKEPGIRAIEEFGVFELAGDPEIMQPVDRLLETLVKQHRMKPAGIEYSPCYRILRQ